MCHQQSQQGRSAPQNQTRATSSTSAIVTQPAGLGPARGADRGRAGVLSDFSLMGGDFGGAARSRVLEVGAGGGGCAVTRCPSPPGDAGSCPWAKTRVSPRAALRSPRSSSSPFTSSLGMVPHAALSGELPTPGLYMGIHLSPQVSSAVLYGRSPMVSHRGRGRVCCLSLGRDLGGMAVGRAPLQRWLGCEAAGGFRTLREDSTGCTGV